MTKQKKKSVDGDQTTPIVRTRTSSQHKSVNIASGEVRKEGWTKKRHDRRVNFATYSKIGPKMAKTDQVVAANATTTGTSTAPPTEAAAIKREGVEEGQNTDHPVIRQSPLNLQPPPADGGSQGSRDLFRTRAISPCRVVSESLFIDRDISWAKTIQKPDMWPFFSLNEPVYSDLVRDFYANMMFAEGDDSSLDTTVRYVKIHLDVRKLADILQIPSESVSILHLNKEEQEKAYKEAVRYAHDKGKGRQSLNNIADLSAENRLLHQIITYMVLPRSGAYSTVHRVDLLLLVNILKGKKINLPQIILSEMIRSVRQKLAFSPYGSVLTKVFKHFNILIHESADANGLTTYDGKSLKLMGIGTDCVTKKLVRLKDPAPTRKRSVGNGVAGVLEIVLRLEKKFDKMENKLDKREKKRDQKMEKMMKKLDKFEALLKYALGMDDEVEETEEDEGDADDYEDEGDDEEDD